MRWMLLLSGLIMLVGCDDRAASLREFNDIPHITLQAERGGEKSRYLQDSVKISNPEYAYMPFIIDISDPNANIKHVRHEVTSGAGYLVFRGERLTTDTVRVIDDHAVYRFVPLGAGTTTVRFVVTDYFNQSDSATLQLYVFANLAPVADLQTTYIGAADKYEYLFDAGSSYDKDQSFGGTVTKYLFSVGTTRIAETVQPAIHYIFPGPGSYAVRLQVVDNDGTVSKEVTQTIQVNN